MLNQVTSHPLDNEAGKWIQVKRPPTPGHPTSFSPAWFLETMASAAGKGL